MTFYDIRGREVKKNTFRHLIKWDEPSRSKLQRSVKQFLKPFWMGHIVFEEFPVYGTGMKVDILNATRKIAIEVNGKQHSEYTPFFHGKDEYQFLKSIKRDVRKLDWLELNNYVLIEIEYDEVDKLSKSFFKKKYDIEL